MPAIHHKSGLRITRRLSEAGMGKVHTMSGLTRYMPMENGKNGHQVALLIQGVEAQVQVHEWCIHDATLRIQ